MSVQPLGARKASLMMQAHGHEVDETIQEFSAERLHFLPAGYLAKQSPKFIQEEFMVSLAVAPSSSHTGARDQEYQLHQFQLGAWMQYH